MVHPQPALAVARMRRITNRQIARALGRTPHWVGRVLNGLDAPSPKFRKALAEYLDLPEAALFRDDPPKQGAA